MNIGGPLGTSTLAFRGLLVLAIKGLHVLAIKGLHVLTFRGLHALAFRGLHVLAFRGLHVLAIRGLHALAIRGLFVLAFRGLPALAFRGLHVLAFRGQHALAFRGLHILPFRGLLALAFSGLLVLAFRGLHVLAFRELHALAFRGLLVLAIRGLHVPTLRGLHALAFRRLHVLTFRGLHVLAFRGLHILTFRGLRALTFGGLQVLGFRGLQALTFRRLQALTFRGLHALTFRGLHVLAFRGLHALAFRGLQVLAFRGLHALAFRGLNILTFRGQHTLAFSGLHVLTSRDLHALAFRGLHVLTIRGLHALAFKGLHVLNFRGLPALAFRGLHVLAFRGLDALAFRGLLVLAFRGLHALSFRGLHLLTFRGLHILAIRGLHVLAIRGLYVLIFRGLHALAFSGLHVLTLRGLHARTFKGQHVLTLRWLHAFAFRGLHVLTFRGLQSSTSEEYTPSPSEDYTSSPLEDYKSSASEGCTSSSSEGYMPSPSEGYMLSPSEDYTSSPSEGNTPSPTEDYVSSPLEGYMPSPLEDYTSSPSKGSTPSPSVDYSVHALAFRGLLVLAFRGLHALAFRGLHVLAFSGLHALALRGLHVLPFRWLHTVAFRGLHVLAIRGLHALALRGLLVLAFRGLHALALRGLHVVAFRGLHALAFRGLHVLTFRGLHALSFWGLHVLTFRGLHAHAFRGLHVLAYRGLHGLAIRGLLVLAFRGLHALAFRGLHLLTFRGLHVLAIRGLHVLTIRELHERLRSVGKASGGTIDVLTIVIGRPKHLGRVRAAGADVTIKQYFGLATRTSHTSSSIAPKDMEQLRQKIRDQLEESITEKVTRQVMLSFSQMQSQFQSPLKPKRLEALRIQQASYYLKPENHIKTDIFVTGSFEMGPGSIATKTFENIKFPKGHVGIKSFDAELVDQEGNSIPSYETYLHHWLAIKYHQNITMSPNPKLRRPENAFFQRNKGTCNGGILPHYWGFGVESRGTTSKIPDPFAIEQDKKACTQCRCDHMNLPKEFYNVTRDIHNQKLTTNYKGGLFCCEDNLQCKQIEGFQGPRRMVSLRYKISWVDWNIYQIPVKVYILDSTDKVRSNDSKILHDCLAEYTIPATGGGGDSPHVQKANIPMEKGGYLIYGTAHMHSGVVNATLYGQDGRTLCTSTPKYGIGKEAGNEKGYLIGMSVCYPQPGSIKIHDGEILTLESRYKNEFQHPGRVRAAGADVMIKQYFEPAPRTSHTSSSMTPKDMEQLRQKIRDQLEESITEKVTRQVMLSFSQMQSRKSKATARWIVAKTIETTEIGGASHPTGKLLFEIIGRPEHHGRVHATGADVTIKQYFGPAPRTSHTSSSMAPKDMEQLTQKIRDQLEESITEKQPGPLGPSRRFLQKVVASGGSNPARLGELGGKHLPYFAINRGGSQEEKEETQEQMKADMSTLKEQMASMMEAMLGMRQLMEKNAATAAAVSSAAEADPTLLATAHHPPSGIVGRGRDTLGHDGNPHLGYNRAAYPYGLPPNYSPPVLQDDAGHIASPVLEREPPQQPDEVHKDPQDYARRDVEFYPPIPEGPAPSTLPQPNIATQPIPKAPTQREAPQVPTPNTTRPAGSSNATRNFPPRPFPKFTPLPMTYEDLLPSLITNHLAVVTPGKVLLPPFPKWYDPNATCKYHGGVPGHSVEKCLALKYKVQHLIDAGWLTFQEDRPNVRTNPLANHGGGAVNAVESDRPRRSKPLRDVATPRRFIFEALQKGGLIPHSGCKEDSCLLHSGELHDMETCLGVEELLQRMIDQGRLEVGSEGKEEQHICMQSTDGSSVAKPKPLVIYFTKGTASQKPRHPLAAKPVPFPYQNSHAVPWRYTPPREKEEEATDVSSLSAKVTNITGLSGVTRSGRVFAPPDLPVQPADVKGKGKVGEEQNGEAPHASNKDIPAKGLLEKKDGKNEVSLEEASEFLRIIQKSEFKVIEQLNKTPARWIPFDADAIGQLLGYLLVLEEGQECEYGQRRNRSDGFDEEAIAQLLCIPGQDFARTAVGRRVRIMRTNMTTLTQIWMTLLLSNILPTDHNSDLPLPKCQLVYAILTRMSVHVAQLIADAIYIFAGEKTPRLFQVSQVIKNYVGHVTCTLLSSRGGRPDDMRRQNLVIPHPFAIQTQSCLMARRDKIWSFCTLLSSRGGGPDDTRRQNLVIPHPFAIQTQSCPMARRDKIWSFCTLLSSRGGGPDDTRRYLTVIHTLLSSRGGGPDDTRRHLTVIRTLLSSRGGGPDDKQRPIWSFRTPLPFRHSRVRWHAETNYDPLGPSRRFLQKAVASGGSNPARLGELGGKHLPYFAINRGGSEEEKSSAP
ncbi:Dynein heavy chain [Glycine soja]